MTMYELAHYETMRRLGLPAVRNTPMKSIPVTELKLYNVFTRPDGDYVTTMVADMVESSADKVQFFRHGKPIECYRPHQMYHVEVELNELRDYIDKQIPCHSVGA